MASETREQTLQVRAEGALVEALDQLAAGNGVKRSEMARLLMRRGMRAVAEDSDGAAREPLGVRGAVSREATVARAEYLMELLSGLAHELEELDPIASWLLVRSIERSAHEWLSPRQGPTQRLAELLENVTALVEAQPPGERLGLWSVLLNYTTERSRRDYDAMTGDLRAASGGQG